MNRLIRCLILAVTALALASPAKADDVVKIEDTLQEDVEKSTKAEEKLDPKEIIFEHLGDAYGWEVPFSHSHRIPLPVIVKATDGWHIFSSAHLEHGATYNDNGTVFRIAPQGEEHAGKVVQIADGRNIRPLDISITKDVAGVFICIIIVLGLMLWLRSYHLRNPYKAPRKGLGAVEAVVVFIYDTVIKATLGHRARRFAPYLLAVFFFILTMNLMGLIVIFPGGANLSGNIAVTLVLSIITFLITNIFSSKHYWKDILWPDVPLWLKFPLPIMPVIEVFGMFTKPAALTVRLFANMMGGHIIVIVLTLLIFIFSAINPVAGGATTVVSVAFSVFMLLIDVLVSFIQAYVFTILSTIFISLSQKPDHAESHEQATVPTDRQAAAAVSDTSSTGGPLAPAPVE